MKQYIIALDVGGTSIKSGVVNSNLDLVESTITTYPSQSDQDAETIINNIYSIIINQWEKLQSEEGCILGVGFGFPGPFDYIKGISYIHGLGKYEAIYGMDVAQALQERVDGSKIRLAPHYQITFENDATVFVLGEYRFLQSEGFQRLMGITLGTGCGSSFIERGKVIRGEYGLPKSGFIFDQPFKGKIVDDYISRRGILELAANNGFDTNAHDVGDLAILANKSDAKAKQVFSQFGILLGEALKAYIREFRPEVLVIGGQISKAYRLFSESFLQQLAPLKLEMRISKNLSKSALIGAANVVLKAVSG